MKYVSFISECFCAPGESVLEVWDSKNRDLSLCFATTSVTIVSFVYMLTFGLFYLRYLWTLPRSDTPDLRVKLDQRRGALASTLMAFSGVAGIIENVTHVEDPLLPFTFFPQCLLWFVSFSVLKVLLFLEERCRVCESRIIKYFLVITLISFCISSEVVIHQRIELVFSAFTLSILIVLIPLCISYWFIDIFRPDFDARSFLSGEDRSSHLTESPESQAPIWSRLTFEWMTSLIKKGSQQSLVPAELYSLRSDETAQHLGLLVQQLWNEEVSKYAPDNRSIVRVYRRAFGSTVIEAGKCKLVYDTLMFSGPICLNLIISYLTNIRTESAESFSKGYFYVILLLTTSVAQSFFLHQYFHRMFRVGMRLRSSTTALIYRKALRINPGWASCEEGKTPLFMSSGELVNLMSTDTVRLQDLMVYFHILWSAPYQICISLVLLSRVIGWACLGGLSVMVFSVPLTGLVAQRIKEIQNRIMTIKDERLRVMNEMLGAIRVLKYYSWEVPFMRKVLSIRENEQAKLWQYQLSQIFSRMQWLAVPSFVSLASLGLYVWNGHTLDAATAFTALALFNVLRFPMQLLPFMVNSLAEARVSVKRINRFLNLPELPCQPFLPVPMPFVVAVSVERASLAWSNGDEFLKDVSLECPAKKLTAIIGATGAGKSGLLQALIGDVSVTKGLVTVHGRVSYCAQQSWIQNGTVKFNICFGQPFEPNKYAHVIHACALEKDLEVLPAGDETEIGEKGINLSGGQKQRVALARAVYGDRDIYILDDPLSAVDSHVANHIWIYCLKKLLKDKTILLVTHKVNFLPQCHNIVFIHNGKVEYSGAYQGLKGNKHFDAFTLYEARHDGVDSASPSKDNDVKSPLGPENQVDEKQKLENQLRAKTEGALIEQEYLQVGKVPIEVYYKYLDGIGGLRVFIPLLFGLAFNSVAQIGANGWLSYWSDHPETVTMERGIISYASLLFLQLSITSVGYYLVAVAAQKASRYFHSRLLVGVLKAPMSLFEATPLGRIINRFSRDTYTIDETLPATFTMYLNTIFGVLSTVSVITYATPWFLIIIMPLGIFYMAVQSFYIPSARQLQRIESASRSPIFSHFDESLHGASTIRAFRAQHRFVSSNETLINRNCEAYYLYVSANRWLAMRLELVGSGIVTGAALLAVSAAGLISPGIGGLAISYALNVTQTLNWLVRMASDLESNSVSVERILEYAERLPSEHYEGQTIPKNWPQRGEIEFDHVSLKYRNNTPLVLVDLSIKIGAGEKIGIVGRTGAGKSSLLVSLLRIVEVTEGYIFIDDLDIRKIPLTELRKNFSIIPQDPVLFSGTLRFNLDPFAEYQDAEIWYALEMAHLKSHLLRVKPIDSLSLQIAEGGTNFSMGQRQLVCLARALLRKCKILLLDEATSVVDPKTDQLIQATIREEFKFCTILTIAHRIDTVLDYDKIAVLENGKLIEFDTPQNLIENTQSLFSSFLTKTPL